MLFLGKVGSGLSDLSDNSDLSDGLEDSGGGFRGGAGDFFVYF